MIPSVLDPATSDSLEKRALRFPDSASCQQNRAKGRHFSREPKLSDSHPSHCRVSNPTRIGRIEAGQRLDSCLPRR